MSVCYGIACKTRHLYLWVGQSDYLYTVEPEITAFARFLKIHRGEEHPLIFDDTQEFIYGYREIDAKTFAVVEDDFFDDATEPKPETSSPGSLPSALDGHVP